LLEVTRDLTKKIHDLIMLAEFSHRLIYMDIANQCLWSNC